MIIAVDNTGSNDIKGPGGSGLHDVDPSDPFPTTPYEFVLQGLGRRVLSALDKDAVVPMYGFGDSVCSSHPSGCRLLGMAHGMDDARAIYRDYVTDTRIGRSGPTSFAGVISQAMDRVRETGRYHTLIIISDGAVDDEPEAGGESLTAAAIVEAANLPLAIITVGVGVGPVSVALCAQVHRLQHLCAQIHFGGYASCAQICRRLLSLAFPGSNKWGFLRVFRAVGRDGTVRRRPGPKTMR